MDGWIRLILVPVIIRPASRRKTNELRAQGLAQWLL